MTKARKTAAVPGKPVALMTIRTRQGQLDKEQQEQDWTLCTSKKLQSPGVTWLTFSPLQKSDMEHQNIGALILRLMMVESLRSVDCAGGAQVKEEESPGKSTQAGVFVDRCFPHSNRWRNLRCPWQ